MLGNHGYHFGMPQENLPHFSGGRLAVFERERGGHGSANPEIAFFQVRKKLAPEPRCDQEKCSKRESNFDSHYKRAVTQRKVQRRSVKAVQQADDGRFGFLHTLREQHGSEHRSNGEGCEQGPRKRVAVRACHRAENLALYSLHRE